MQSIQIPPRCDNITKVDPSYFSFSSHNLLLCFHSWGKHICYLLSGKNVTGLGMRFLQAGWGFGFFFIKLSLKAQCVIF